MAYVMGAALTVSTQTMAQQRVEVNGHIDVVSNYVWRGMDQNSGFSVQPALGLAYKGFALSAWGSQSITNGAERDVQEFDVCLSYACHGWTTTLTDYWWGGLHNPYGYYKQGPGANPIDGGHHLEATLTYSFGDKCPINITWSTWLAGTDVRTNNDKRCFSTYINASCDIPCPGEFTLTPSVGFTPWQGYYHSKAAFTDIALKAAKNIAISKRLTMPLFVQAIASPTGDHVYLVAGAGIKL